MSGHKTTPDKLNKTEIISSLFSHQDDIKLEINYRKTRKFTNTQGLNHTLLYNQGINEEILKNKNKKIPQDK